MNQKQAKRARGIANREAVKRKLWKQGEASVYSKWWRKILAKFFPKLRKKYSDLVGRWYKSTLKHWSRLAYQSIHDQDYMSFMHTREKLFRKEQARRMHDVEEGKQ